MNENPDYVTLEIGINDIHNRTPLLEFEKSYRELLDDIKQKSPNATIIILNIPYLGSSQIVYFPYNLLLDYETTQYNSVIKSIASDKRIRYIDLNSKIREQFRTNPALYSDDQFHPSAEGYKLWGQIINDPNS